MDASRLQICCITWNKWEREGWSSRLFFRCSPLEFRHKYEWMNENWIALTCAQPFLSIKCSRVNTSHRRVCLDCVIDQLFAASISDRAGDLKWRICRSWWFCYRCAASLWQRRNLFRSETALRASCSHRVCLHGRASTTTRSSWFTLSSAALSKAKM